MLQFSKLSLFACLFFVLVINVAFGWGGAFVPSYGVPVGWIYNQPVHRHHRIGQPKTPKTEMSDEGNTEEEKTQVPELYTLIQLIVGIKD